MTTYYPGRIRFNHVPVVQVHSGSGQDSNFTVTEGTLGKHYELSGTIGVSGGVTGTLPSITGSQSEGTVTRFWNNSKGVTHVLTGSDPQCFVYHNPVDYHVASGTQFKMVSERYSFVELTVLGGKYMVTAGSGSLIGEA